MSKIVLKGGYSIPIFGAPSLDKANADGAYTSEGIDGLEALIDGHVGHVHEVGLVEDLELTLGRYLDNGGQVPIVPLVAIRRLHKHGVFGEAFGEHLTVLVREHQALADIVTRHFDLN